MRLVVASAVGILLLFAACVAPTEERMPTEKRPANDTALATFAGGCFWCMEPPFEKLPGVLSVTSGYAGGTEPDPTYEEVSSGSTGYLESVQIAYDPKVIDYATLLDTFWQNVDPTDDGGQFVDRGKQYKTLIFTHTPEQARLAQASKEALAATGKYGKPIITEIRPYTTFYPAEDYHQDYYVRNPVRYKFYRHGSGRDAYLDTVWGANRTGQERITPRESGTSASGNASCDPRWSCFVKNDATLKGLTPEQYAVTQEEGTERPFKNAYWDNHAPGIYVDVVSGEPLFSSLDKYDSGTGWPSFSKPIEPANIVTKEDRTLWSTRTEVRSMRGDSHLGHVFDDGPKEQGGLRYCMNSAALRFIPVEKLEEEGYGAYLSLFASASDKNQGS